MTTMSYNREEDALAEAQVIADEHERQQLEGDAQQVISQVDGQQLVFADIRGWRWEEDVKPETR